MKRFTKTIAKEFTSGFGRFVAIMAIIALGVGFMIGVMQATPDMKNSMDKYYEENAAFDLGLKSVYAFSEDDVAEVLALQDENGKALTERAFAYTSADAPVTITRGGEADVETIARVNAVDFAALQGDGGVNRLTLVEGRFPEKPHEVVVQRKTNYILDVKVGDVITVTGDTTLDFDVPLSKSVLTESTFEVVGVVSSPDYYYFDAREVTTLGTGVLGTIFYAQESVFDLTNNMLFKYLYNNLFYEEEGHSMYTDISVLLKGSDERMAFTPAFEDFVKGRIEDYKELGAKQCVALNAELKEFASLAGDLPAAEWYVLDIVTTNLSYIGFGMNAEKVADIAGIFPVFFIVVAALVALTSMTRMVEEDRMQIGTFKALGYTNGRIMSKYMIYCCIASIVGCVVGVLFGFSLLPTIFWQAYKIMYYLPPLSLAFSPWFAVITLAVALAGTMLVTYFAARSSLKEKPSQLMQPKAPKAGKRIFLERAGFFWNHLKFKYKATLRNIFRYKRNMFMTILSVMGCTALMLVGFGLNDSVTAAIDTQFNEIVQYEALVEYSAIDEGGALESFLQGTDCEDYVSLYGEDGHVELQKDGEKFTESVELYAVKADDQKFNSFLALRNSKKSAIIDLSKNGVAISENIADGYGVAVGDSIVYRRSDGTKETLTVTAIAENYMGNYLYVDSAYYAELFGEKKDNTLFVKTGISPEDYDDLAKTLLSDSGVNGVTFTANNRKTYEGLEQTMGFVIAVLVVCAGALAAIVLYNLTNINIDERRREIATLRVLGYRKREVAGYIYRESAVLTVIGALLGLGLGVLLHMFLVTRINGVAMMFASVIGVGSYFYSLGLTVLFAGIVYAFMLIKLNKINMADSLKSNE